MSGGYIPLGGVWTASERRDTKDEFYRAEVTVSALIRALEDAVDLFAPETEETLRVSSWLKHSKGLLVEVKK